MDMLAYTPVEFNFWETLAKTFIILAIQRQFIEKNYNNTPVRRIVAAKCTNSAFTGSYTENPFWYQQFDLRQTKIVRGGQPTVDFDAADYCRVYVTTIKAMNSRKDIASIPIHNSQDHYVLVFALTSTQDVTEKYHYPQLVVEPPRLKLNFVLSLEHVTELNALGERMPSIVVDKFGVVGKKI